MHDYRPQAALRAYIYMGLWSKRRQVKTAKPKRRQLSKERQVQNKRKSVLSYADYMKSISALLQLLVSSDGLAR